MKTQFRTSAAMLFILSALLLLLTACGDQNTSSNNTTSSSVASPTPSSEAAALENKLGEHRKDGKPNPVVTIEMNTGDTIKVRLYPDVAPNTVNNFISLVKKGFYDGLIFHRVIPGFMIQGGDPDGKGSGGPGYNIKGEFTGNGFQNDLLHKRGVISMARTDDPNSAGSQFFIMAADYPSLDGQYASFGEVFMGMDTVDKIVNQERDDSDRPKDPMSMKKVTVDTFGVEYPEPEKVK